MELEQIMQALRNAHAAGDTDAATRLAAMARAAQSDEWSGSVGAQPGMTPAPDTPVEATLPPGYGERGVGDVIIDNLIGRDDGVQSYGESLGRLVNAAGAGAGRGVEGLLNLPSAALSGGEWVADRTLLPAMTSVGIIDEGNAEAIRNAQVVNVPSVSVPDALTEFEPETRAERYAGTVGEFLPSSLLGPSGAARNMIQFGILPGLASEAAGQATEGTAIEPFARIGAGLAAPMLMARRAETALRGVMRPETSRVRAANALQSQGVTPTAGQATGSDFLRRLEGATAPSGQQLDDYTAASMRYIGSDSPRATPEALRAAQAAIVQRMDDAIGGVSVTPNQSMAQAADDIAAGYVQRVPAGQLTPRIRGIAEEIAEQATSPNPQPIALSQLREWRSDIGRLTSSPDEATRVAAHGLRTLIDDATDTALIAAGREADIPALAAARNDYRNFLAVRDAATRAGAEGGTLSPTQLNQSVIRTQGRENYGIGRNTDLGDFTRGAAEVLRPLPTVNPGGVRALEGGAGAALGLLGYSQGGVGPAIAGLLAPVLGRAALRTPAVQNAIANPASALGALPALSSGLLADRVQ